MDVFSQIPSCNETIDYMADLASLHMIILDSRNKAFVIKSESVLDVGTYMFEVEGVLAARPTIYAENLVTLTIEPPFIKPKFLYSLPSNLTAVPGNAIRINLPPLELNFDMTYDDFEIAFDFGALGMLVNGSLEKIYSYGELTEDLVGEYIFTIFLTTRFQ